jgi:hypothetical protein
MAQLPLAAIATVVSATAAVGGTVLAATAPHPKAPVALQQATIDDAAQQQNTQDELAKRRGGVADILTGSGGVLPPGAGQKLLLGQ